jgi:SAM-dependent methyltransferase
MNDKLGEIYELRFSGYEDYRTKVWQILVNNFFNKWIRSDFEILDLGCGYGEFINKVNCSARYAMDLNPRTKDHLDKEIIFYEQDCSMPWELKPSSLDLVFTSNFFEHLPNKSTLDSTVRNIYKALKPNGLLIAMGPNISILKGRYWDFWDHHVALSEQSISELLEINRFKIKKSVSQFLPYNMVRVKKRPLFLLKLYLKMPFAWKIFGKQFLVTAKKA